MALCRDDAVSTLNSMGFDIVRYPRPDISCLDVIVESNGQFTRLGQLARLWRSPKPLPSIQQNSTPGVAMVQSSKLHGKFGVQALLDALGGVSGEFGGESIKSMQLTAEEPVVLSCSQDAVENYVAEGMVDSQNASSRYFYDDGVRVYVITEVIASSKLKIIIGDEANAEATAAAADLSESISASVSTGSARASGNTISYERSPAAVFGFKSAEVVYDNGWVLELPARPGKKFLGRSPEGREQLMALRAPGARLPLQNSEE